MLSSVGQKFDWAAAKRLVDQPGRRAVDAIETEHLCVGRVYACAGESVAPHVHDIEHWVMVISGRVEVTCGGKREELMPATLFCVPANAVHSLRVLEDCVMLELALGPTLDARPASGASRNGARLH